jgi:hypothetical protein
MLHVLERPGVYIDRFEFQDLRCFEGTHGVSLNRGDGTHAGWTVFAGRNASGKTSLLQALVLGYVDLESAQNLNRGARWTRRSSTLARAWVHRWTGQAAEACEHRVFMGFDTPDADPRLRDINSVANGPVSGSATTQFFEVLRGDGPPYPETARTPPTTPLIAYGSLRLGPHREQPREPSPDPLISRVEHLLDGGGPLTHAITWLKDVHLRALEKRPGFDDLKREVLALLNDGLLPEGSSAVRVDADGLWVERHGLKLPVHQISDGYRATANLVVDLARHLHACHGSLDLREVDGHVVCPRPAVVLIDEIDAHLHVSWQREIGFWLTRHFPHIQFLVTTHSPFICQAASPRGLLLLPSDPAERIRHVDEDTYRAVVYGTLDEAVLSKLFGLEHARSDRAERRFDELGRLEARLLEGRATAAERERYQALKAQVGDSLGAAVRRTLAALGAGGE